MISKEMLKRCQNEAKQAFCALYKDVQGAMRENGEYVQILRGHKRGVWWDKFTEDLDVCPEKILRLSPDTPTEPEYVEYDVYISKGSTEMYMVKDGSGWGMQAYPAMAKFLGIIYQRDGIETLRTSIDAAFGAPVRVRFSKP